MEPGTHNGLAQWLEEMDFDPTDVYRVTLDLSAGKPAQATIYQYERSPGNRLYRNEQREVVRKDPVTVPFERFPVEAEPVDA